MYMFFVEPLLLVVGILSARENFKLREAVRSTWLQEYSLNENIAVKAWFIIGKKDCKIPPDYRLSKYECNKWNINVSGKKHYVIRFQHHIIVFIKSHSFKYL